MKAERDYFCEPAELARMEREIVIAARGVANGGVVVVWLDPRVPIANFVRTVEAGFFPEVADLSEELDLRQRMFVLVDIPSRSVIHATSFYEFEPEADPEVGELTGFYTIDSMICAGHLTASRFYEYCAAMGINVEWCLSVETNMSLGPRHSEGGVRSAYLAYAVLARELMRRASSLGVSAVFASVNERQLSSFAAAGVPIRRVLDLDETATQENELGRYSLPVMLLLDEPLFALLEEFLGGITGETALPG